MVKVSGTIQSVFRNPSKASLFWWDRFRGETFPVLERDRSSVLLDTWRIADRIGSDEALVPARNVRISYE